MAIAINRIRLSSQQTSTSTSTFEIFSHTTAANTNYRVVANVLATRTDTSPTKPVRNFILVASFCNVAGTLTNRDDALSTTLYDSGTADSSSAIGVPTFFVNGTAIQLLTHQTSTQTILWDGDIEIQAYTFV